MRRFPRCNRSQRAYTDDWPSAFGKWRWRSQKSVLGVVGTLLMLVATAQAASAAPECRYGARVARSALSDPLDAGDNAPQVECFLDSLGVNNHMTRIGTLYDRPALVLKELQYLGVRHVRDMVSHNLGHFGALAQAGIRFDAGFATSDEEITRDLPRFLAILDVFVQRFPGSVAAFEGPNEPNCQRAFVRGRSTTVSAAATAEAQRLIFAAVRADQHLQAIPVLASPLNLSCPALGGAVAYRNAVGDLAAGADMGNAHVYATQRPPRANMRSSQWGVPFAQAAVPDKPVMMTEFGYSTPVWLDEVTAARYTLFGLADAFKDGVARTYVYELMDGRTGDVDTEDNFGLFHSNGSAKPAADAIHNLTTILRAPTEGSATETLTPTLQGLPQTGAALSLRDGSGGYALLLWDEALAHSDTRVLVDLGTITTRAELFDPLHGTEPMQRVAGAASVQVSLGRDLLVLRVTPASPAPARRP